MRDRLAGLVHPLLEAVPGGKAGVGVIEADPRAHPKTAGYGPSFGATRHVDVVFGNMFAPAKLGAIVDEVRRHGIPVHG